MTRKKLIHYVFLSILLLLSNDVLSQESTITLIHAGTLLAIPGEEPLRQQTVVVTEGRITQVYTGYKSPADLKIKNAQVVDLKEKFVLPGLIDCHTHISTQRDPTRNPHDWLTKYEADETLRALPFLSNTLLAGFTTVRNLGSYFKVILPLKRAIENGTIVGPRIIAATGSIAATGGHGDFHGYREELYEIFGTNVGICDGADDCRRAVRALVRQGAEVIKIAATGGVLSNTTAGVGQQLTDEELKAIVETANSLGRKVASHAHGVQGVNASLRAGVHSIEHGSFLDDESIRLFKEHNAYLVPTLLAGVTLANEMKSNKNIPPAILDKINKVVPDIEASFRKALAADIKMAFGTDSGVSKHGDNAKEFEILVQYGMSPAKAIWSATVSASKLLDMEKEVGTIESGKWADIIATDNNPLRDIRTLQKVNFVMKAGKIYKGS